jgi:hypothetical protein
VILNCAFTHYPLALPRVDMMQIWHERTHNGRLRCWLRLKIQQHAQVLVESRTMLDVSNSEIQPPTS